MLAGQVSYSIPTDNLNVSLLQSGRELRQKRSTQVRDSSVELFSERQPIASRGSSSLDGQKQRQPMPPANLPAPRTESWSLDRGSRIGKAMDTDQVPWSTIINRTALGVISHRRGSRNAPMADVHAPQA